MKSDNYDYWLERVRRNGSELQNVPEHLRDKELCITALTQSASAFQYVPEQYFGDDFYTNAVEMNGFVLAYVPEVSKTRELCLTAAQQGTDIRFVPEEFLDREMVGKIVRHNPYQIKRVPQSFVDIKLISDYVINGKAYDLDEICHKADIPVEKVAFAITRSGLDKLDRLPGYAVTSSVYTMAEGLYANDVNKREWQATKTRHKPSYLEGQLSRADLKQLKNDPVAYRRYHISIFFQAWAIYWDEEFLLRMVDRADGRIIAKISESFLNERICFNAVSQSGMLLQFVPETLRTLPVCLQAVQNDKSAMVFIPARWREQIRKSL